MSSPAQVTTLLERLKHLTGVEFGWRAAHERPEPGVASGAVEVDGCFAGALTTHAQSLAPKTLEAAADLAGEWLAREHEITELVDEVLRGYEQVQMAQRVTRSLAGMRDDRRLCEAVLHEIAVLLRACTATVFLHPVDGGAERCWSVRTEGVRVGKRPAQDWLEVPIVISRAGAEVEEIGILRLQGRRAATGFGEEDRKLARALASQLGVFLRMAQVVEEARCGGRTGREREITREAHASLLPKEEPHLPGVEVAGACLPAEPVGGDHYGYLVTEVSVMTTMIAKVSNSGLRATMAMSGVRSLLRAEISRTGSPAEALRATNRALSRDLQPVGLFSTAFLARYDTRKRHLCYAGAGHSLALLWHAGDGRFERLERGGLAMGIFEDVVYEQGECDLFPGDLLVMFTDGLAEARNPAGECFGLERLCHEVMVYRHERPRTLMYRLLEAVESFRSSQVQSDDLTLVVLKATKEKP
ncbi:MAG: PP2C family protein-serine/threonine phosphatase [Acidobacteriota bacterium]